MVVPFQTDLNELKGLQRLLDRAGAVNQHYTGNEFYRDQFFAAFHVDSVEVRMEHWLKGKFILHFQNGLSLEIPVPSPFDRYYTIWDYLTAQLAPQRILRPNEGEGENRAVPDRPE